MIKILFIVFILAIGYGGEILMGFGANSLMQDCSEQLRQKDSIIQAKLNELDLVKGERDAYKRCCLKNLK